MKIFKVLTIMSISLVGFTTSLVYAMEFKDVAEDSLYFDAIDFLADEGVVNGNSDGTYAPERALNRAELLKILVESSSYKNEYKSYIANNTDNLGFEDVPDNSWYTPYVLFGAHKGWVVGYENGKYFKPEQKVLVGESLKMLLKANDIDFYETNRVWYEHVVSLSGEMNIIPIEIKSFDAALTRGQMADMMTRLLKYNSNELATYLGSEKSKKYLSYVWEGDLMVPVVKDLEETQLTCVAEGESLGALTADGASGSNGGCCEGLEKYFSNQTTGTIGECYTSEQVEFLESVSDSKLVRITADGFDSKTTGVWSGTTIMFDNRDTESRTIDCDEIDDFYSSCGELDGGESCTYTFSTAGTFTIYDMDNEDESLRITVM